MIIIALYRRIILFGRLMKSCKLANRDFSDVKQRENGSIPISGRLTSVSSWDLLTSF
jgi:hypothetical protein